MQTQVEHQHGNYVSLRTLMPCSSATSNCMAFATQAEQKLQAHKRSKAEGPTSTARRPCKTPSWYPSTHFFRATAVCLLWGLITHQDETNAVVADVWDVLRENVVFKHDSFEPVLATLSFAFWIWAWYIVDVFSTKLSVLHQFVISPDTRNFDEHHRGYCALSGLAYIVPLLIFDTLRPRRTLPQEAPTALGVIGGVIAAVWLYDLLFFPIHLCLHKVKSLRWIHHRHHAVGKPLVSTEVLRHSRWELAGND
jgi:hypothetical protein